MNFYQDPKQNSKGFTLIELLVAIGLFATVMTMSVGIILSVIGGNKKAQAINSVANNLNFALESLTRDLKTGYDYYCNDNVTTVKLYGQDAVARGCVGSFDHGVIQFVSTISGSEKAVSYKYFENGSDGGYLAKKTCTLIVNVVDQCTEYVRVTSPDIDLKEVGFYVKAAKEGEEEQPAVLIILRGTSKLENNAATDFNIQTYVSQRLLNI